MKPIEHCKAISQLKFKSKLALDMTAAYPYNIVNLYIST